jgi:hypothetical protein
VTASPVAVYPSGTDRRRGTRLGGRPELLLLHFLQGQRDRSVEDDAGIAIRDLAAEKRLQAPKLLVGLLADGELHAVALRGSGLDDRAECRNEDRG